jgi:hypothetical protein
MAWCFTFEFGSSAISQTWMTLYWKHKETYVDLFNCCDLTFKTSPALWTTFLSQCCPSGTCSFTGLHAVSGPKHAVHLTTDPQPHPKRVIHRVRSSASSFNFLHPLVSLRSSSSCLRIRPLLLVPSTFTSITCCQKAVVPTKEITTLQRFATKVLLCACPVTFILLVKGQISCIYTRSWPSTRSPTLPDPESNPGTGTVSTRKETVRLCSYTDANNVNALSRLAKERMQLQQN